MVKYTNKYYSSKESIEQICLFTDSLNADNYILQLVHPSLLPIRKILNKEEVFKYISFLRFKNVNGYHVYCRPNSLSYFLIDDISESNLSLLKSYDIRLIVETSPQNYQAWLFTKYELDSEDCKAIALKLDADLSAAQPEQLGRLPGFNNRKHKHKQPDGSYPIVSVVSFKSSIEKSLPPGACASSYMQTVRIQQDRSAADFRLVCEAIRQNKSDFEIRNMLLEYSDKIRHSNTSRKSKYIATTIRNARNAVELETFKKYN
jgi:hypothetical protein